MANEALKDQENRFEPGQPVWVIGRDEGGNACDASRYLFMARCGDVVILTSYINDYDWEDTLAYHVQCTCEDYDTHLAVFPVDDCFSDCETCETAVDEERKETDT